MVNKIFVHTVPAYECLYLLITFISSEDGFLPYSKDYNGIVFKNQSVSQLPSIQQALNWKKGCGCVRSPWTSYGTNF